MECMKSTVSAFTHISWYIKEKQLLLYSRNHTLKTLYPHKKHNAWQADIEE